jgi:hypothetical protein
MLTACSRYIHRQVSIKDIRAYSQQVPDQLQVSDADLIFPRSSGIVETINWTLHGDRNTRAFVTSLKINVETLSSIRIAVDSGPDEIKAKNQALVDVLIFLLWKAE